MHRLISLLLLGALTLSIGASAQVSDDPDSVRIAIPVKISARFNVDYGTEGLWVGGWDETGNYRSAYGYGGDGTETAVSNFKMLPGKEYHLDIYEDGALEVISDYVLNVTAPPGFSVSISEPYGTDLIERPKMSQSDFSANFYYDTVAIRVDYDRGYGSSGPAGGPGVASSWDGDRLSWAVGLGSLLNGSPAGSLVIKAEDFTGVTYTPGDLIYSTDAEEVSVIRQSGKIRQVNTPMALADVITVSSTSYKISFYNWYDVGAMSGGVYTIVGGASPFEVYTITKPATDQIRIQRTAGTTSWYTRMAKSGSTWTMYDWTEGGNETTAYLRKVVTTVSGTSPEYRVVQEYGNPGGGSDTLATKTRYTYTTYTWGRELTKLEEGYLEGAGGATMRTTSYEYYTSGADGDRNFLKKVTRPDGGYTEYLYYDDFDKEGLIYQIKSPFQDTANGRVEQYSYGSDGTGERYLSTTVTTSVSGTPVAKVVNIYSNETKNGEPVRKTERRTYTQSSTGPYLTTIIKTYREDASNPYLRGRPYSVARPDGTQTSYAYDSLWLYGEDGSGYYVWLEYRRQHAIHGTTAASGEPGSLLQSYAGDDIEDLYLVTGKSHRTMEMINTAGRLVERLEAVNHSGTNFDDMAKVWHRYDEAARMTKTVRTSYANNVSAGDTTLFEASYDNGQLDWSEDETGELTTYIYDALGRVSMKTIAGGGASGSLPAVGSVHVELSYDGSNRLLSQTFSDGTEDIVSSWTYDRAGRLTSKTLDCCNTVTYTHFPALDPHSPYAQVQTDQVLTTNADGGKILEDYYLDGSLDRRTGTGDATRTAAPPLYVRSMATASGMETWTALESFTIGGSLKDGWSARRLDFAGRVHETESPTYGTGATPGKIFVRNEYNTKGQLTATRTSDTSGGSDILAVSRYEYDAMGQLLLSGLDTDTPAGADLVEASSDRLVKTESKFHEDASGRWWRETTTYAFPTGGSGGVMSGRTRSLIGLPANTLSKTESSELFGSSQSNTTVTTVTVNTNIALATTQVDLVVSPKTSATDRDPSYTYVRHGLLAREVNSAGNDTVYTYDSMRRLANVHGRDNVHSKREYWTGTRRVRYEKDSNGVGTDVTVRTYTYDSSARLSKLERSEWSSVAGSSTGTQTTNYQYNKLGQVEYQWGAGTYPVESVYDAYGRLKEQRQLRKDDGTAKSVVEWIYQPQTGLQWKKRHYTTATATGNAADYKETTLAYTKLGQVSRRTHARGVYTDYGYSLGSNTSTGELLTENHSDTTPDVTYTYDRMGRVATVIDAMSSAAQKRVFSYANASGLRLSKETLGSGYANRYLTWAIERPDLYSDDFVHGAHKSVDYVDPSGDHANWMVKLDGDTGRLERTINKRDGGFEHFFYHFDTDSSRLERVESGLYKQERVWEDWRENYMQTRTYWNSAELARFKLQEISWQGRHNRVRAMNHNTSMLPTKYGAPAAQGNYMEYAHKFDARAQLTDQSILTQSGAAVSGIAGTSYEYDSAGNRTKKGTASYTANGLNEITAWTYDLDGNLLGDGTWTYTYDANNRIRTMAKSTSGADSYLRFTYDYLGRRAKKEVWDNNTGSGAAAQTILFVYRGMDLLAELDSSMQLARSFYWGLDISGTIGGAGGAMGLNYLYDWGTDQGYYPSYDASGNVVGLLDSSGAWKAWYAYSAFGEVLKQDVSTGTYAKENPIGFSTQYTDRETGLVYYGYRYYDPAKGRFTRRDPIGERGGLNLYRFVGNNPLSTVDVRGLRGTESGGGGVSGFLDWLFGGKSDDEEIYELPSFTVIGGDTPAPSAPPPPEDPFQGYRQGNFIADVNAELQATWDNLIGVDDGSGGNGPGDSPQLRQYCIDLSSISSHLTAISSRAGSSSFGYTQGVGGIVGFDLGQGGGFAKGSATWGVAFPPVNDMFGSLRESINHGTPMPFLSTLGDTRMSANYSFGILDGAGVALTGGQIRGVFVQDSNDATNYSVSRSMNLTGGYSVKKGGSIDIEVNQDSFAYGLKGRSDIGLAVYLAQGEMTTHSLGFSINEVIRELKKALQKTNNGKDCE